MKPSKILAKLTFEKEEIEDFIKEKLRENGYVPDGPLDWADDGSLTASVRPMSDDEKQDADLNNADPTQLLLDEVDSILSERFEAIMAVSNTLYNDIQRIKEKLEHQKVPETPRKPASSTPDKPGAAPEAVELVSSEDYGLEEGSGEAQTPTGNTSEVDPEGEFLTPEQAKARKRVERIRQEQQNYREPYAGRKDEEGYVVIKDPDSN